MIRIGALHGGLILACLWILAGCDTQTQTQAPATNGPNASPAYEWVSSPRGEDWKTLSHNMLGFKVDAPSDWSFGIVGKTQKDAVVLLFPDELNTATFSADYQTIEISAYPIYGTVSEVKRNILLFWEFERPITRTEPTLEVPTAFNGRSAERFARSWTSREGIQIVEDVLLLENAKGVRSITIRCAEAMRAQNEPLHQDIITSFSESPKSN
jgi:hypothetical protein